MNRAWQPLVNKILMVLAIAAMIANGIYRYMQPSDEEVQRRMQEGLKELEIEDQVRQSEEKWNKFDEDLDKRIHENQPQRP